MDFRDLSLNQVKDPLEKRMLFLAWLAEKVHENGRKSSPVLVGGGAAAAKFFQRPLQMLLHFFLIVLLFGLLRFRELF